MAKRRLLLNEDQIDIGYRFKQSHPSMVSKTTSYYAGQNVSDSMQQFVESLINDSNLTGSRSFVASTECSAGSIYKINGSAVFAMGGEGLTSTFSVRASIFGNNILPFMAVNGPSSTSEEYIVEFEIMLGFTIESTINKMYVTLKMNHYIQAGQTIGGVASEHYSLSGITISGTSSLDILAGLKYGGIAKTNYILCEKIK